MVFTADAELIARFDEISVAAGFATRAAALRSLIVAHIEAAKPEVAA